MDKIQNGQTEEAQKGDGGRFLHLLAFTALWAIVLVLAALITIAAGAFLVYNHTVRNGVRGGEVVVEVLPGMTAKEIGVLLQDSGLLEHEGFFRLALYLEKEPPSIRHGAYALYEGLSARELLALLQEGPSRHLLANQFRVTIPEGLSVAQASAICANPEAFVQAAGNPQLIASLGVIVPSLEGFLMPNTYFFDEAPDGLTLVTRMVDQFRKEWDALAKAFPGTEGRDKKEIVTIASLVEREAKTEEERPLVAAVIYNRLARQMPLQMDSTLQFALNKYGQRMLNEDREVASPYNTYKYRGLPPGPICSPGISSLRAAINPAKENYLYFVSNADGTTHTFSRTLAEHNQAVSRFRREIAPQRQTLQGQE
ncbi:MAG TPA: endolytic transglycosylase MltG [Candidatus Hydrogenedentes bacterium]|jgi:UPF0755 protein|nr:MAG: putative aminodeoxychorismate lyase [Candidatus Hydrogenedentes bacterium ADurb.Bin170]HNZ49177.1 endolytic transglycosylase MltG [Candidatus Hydrogenedentota bacterium]HOD95300.1 endolytic transglycosylase MltG [Candidatus Hydrogenedentota bacterium]HOH41560.1 endolytic transglycosylase MltG [Candidatus Hydrogenedentota bacterium]HOR50755.1 endolytic transglycosylase MltG [Candidatus Hydrogenedentota bacterium]